jgi:hypothetical protein
MNPQPMFLGSDPYLFISSIASTYPDVTLYDCQHLRSNRPSDGSTHMTGNGQDVSLRHLEIGHLVVGYETRIENDNKFIVGLYISIACMMVYLDHYSYCFARRVRNVERGSLNRWW